MASIQNYRQLPSGMHVATQEAASEQLKGLKKTIHEVKPYLPRDGEALVFDFCWEKKLPLMCVGPPGSAKTTFLQFMSAYHNVPFVRIPFFEGSTISSVRGTPMIWTGPAGEKHMVFRDGPVSTAVRSGEAVIYLDEVRKAGGDILSFFYPMADYDRRFINEATTESIPLSDKVMLAASYNPGQLFGSTELEPAFARRFVTLTFDYLDTRNLAKVALERTGASGESGSNEILNLFRKRMLDGKKALQANKPKAVARKEEIATGFADGVRIVRDAASNGQFTLKEVPGDSAVITALHMVLEGFDYVTATLAAIVNPVLSDLDSRRKQTQEAITQAITARLPNIPELKRKP